MTPRDNKPLVIGIDAHNSTVDPHAETVNLTGDEADILTDPLEYALTALGQIAHATTVETARAIAREALDAVKGGAK